MSATLHLKLWPADRLARFNVLRANAKRAGLRLDVRNMGTRRIPFFFIYFFEAKGKAPPLAYFDTVDDAEAWFAERQA